MGLDFGFLGDEVVMFLVGKVILVILGRFVVCWDKMIFCLFQKKIEQVGLFVFVMKL